jgi:hypothetical protein
MLRIIPAITVSLWLYHSNLYLDPAAKSELDDVDPLRKYFQKADEKKTMPRCPDSGISAEQIASGKSAELSSREAPLIHAQRITDV